MIMEKATFREKTFIEPFLEHIALPKLIAKRINPIAIP